MSTELAVLEVAEKNYPQIYCVGGLDAFYQKAKAEVEGEVPDLSTGKGRKRIATLAADVSRSKLAVEEPGRAYNKLLKSMPKLIDKELREYCDKMDQLRVDTRAPLTAWEAIDKAEKKQIADTAAYLIKFAADLEEGYRDNELYDLKARQAEADRLEQIERARVLAKAEAEREASDRIQQARIDQRAAEQREAKAKQDIIDAQAKADQAEIDRVAAKKLSDWVEYISEAYDYNNQLIAAENARQDVLRRQANEAAVTEAAKAAREADKNHKHQVKLDAMNDFMNAGLDEASARFAVRALCFKNIRHCVINF